MIAALDHVAVVDAIRPLIDEDLSVEGLLRSRSN